MAVDQKRREQPVDRWKVSSIVLGSVFTLLVAGHYVGDADAQPRKIGGQQKGKAPERIGAPAEAPKEAPADGPKEVAPGEQTPSFDNDKKGTPMERAVKVLEHAKRTLTKVKADEDGHRNNAIKHIDTAISEARQIPKAE